MPQELFIKPPTTPYKTFAQDITMSTLESLRRVPPRSPPPRPSRDEVDYSKSDILYDKKTWNVDDLKKKIQDSKAAFSRFSVVRLTHVKNLDNLVWHEYLQVIVRDSHTSKLTRILAERQVANDHVLTGIWPGWKEGDTPPDGSGDTRFPLALFTLEFNSNPISLETFVDVLSAVRAAKPTYNVVTANCYWFALATYVVLYAMYKDTATERRWAWCFYRCIPPTYIAWWDMVTVPLMQIAASLFKRDDMKDKKNPKYRSGGSGDIGGGSLGGGGQTHKPDPLAVKFWAAIQKQMTQEHDGSHDIPSLHNKILSNDQIEAKLSEPNPHVGKPNPVTYPTHDMQEAHPFVDQVHEICRHFSQSPSRDQHLQRATEEGFDKVFTPLKPENVPPEFEQILSLSPGSRLSEDDCNQFNTAIKASVGAVLTMLDAGE